jgi:hypothetical protein
MRSGMRRDAPEPQGRKTTAPQTSTLQKHKEGKRVEKQAWTAKQGCHPFNQPLTQLVQPPLAPSTHTGVPLNNDSSSASSTPILLPAIFTSLEGHSHSFA